MTNTSEQKLENYACNSSGDMNGRSENIKINIHDENYALLSITKKDHYNQKPNIEIYKLDIKILEDIKKIFDKYKMANWHHKKFSNLFAADKRSVTYNFTFSKDDISFSAQIYPRSYLKKLKEIDEVINLYKEKGEKI